MDTKISSVRAALAAAMEEAGYTELTVVTTSRRVGQLAGFCPGGDYSPEAGRLFLESPGAGGAPVGACCLSARRRVVDLVEGYLETGSFDFSPRNPNPPRERPAGDLGDALSEYLDSLASGDLARSTAFHYGDMARLFLLHAQSRGVCGAGGLEPRHVHSFMSAMAERRPGTDSFHIASALRPYLRYLGRDDLVSALRATRPARARKIVEVLTDDEEERVARICCGGRICARDAAITMLALSTGLRAGDICALRLGDVDWDRGSVALVQSKTGNPLALPLAPAVLELVARYVLEERPRTGDDHLFLAAKLPFAPLSGSASVYHATEHALGLAGVRGGGTRLLRHNAATKMLRAGVQAPVISAVLGHADPDSTSTYMETDSERMRACVLPLPRGCSAC